MTTVVLEHLQHANSAGPDLTIDANGFIGVGTVSPVRPLSVVATGNTTSVFERTDGVYVLEMKGSGTTSPAAFGMSGNDLVALVNNSEKLRVDSNGALLLGTTTRNVYYNSSTQYAATAVIKTNISNDVADLVITNGTNNFGSTIDFARTNTAGNDVRYALMGGIATSNATGTETGYLTFRTKDSTDNNIVERMRIDNSGRVTTPYQPSFQAHKTSHLAISGSGEVEAGNWSTSYVSGGHNTGGHFNTTTGRFTAPIAGRYKFDANIMHGITSGDYQIWICVNGNQSNMIRSNSMQSTGGNWKQTTVTGLLNLQANDYISIFVRSSASETYAMYGSTTAAFTTCNGYLLG